jgi:ATP/ADP translocase/HEAT repeat protein
MSRLRSSLATLFPVRPDEVKPLGLLLLLSFFKGLAAVFFDAPANTLFITHFGSDLLPFVYLCAAGSSLVLGFAYARLGSSFAPSKVLRITLGLLLLSILLFYIALLLTKAKWLIMGLMIWKEALFMLGNIVMWASAGYLFNVRQGKRLFGLVASGGILASIIGGALIPFIVKHSGTTLLFLLSALALGAMSLVFRHLTHSYRSQFLMVAETPDTIQEKHSFTDIFKNRYLGLFFSLSILSNFGFFFVDYVYFNRVEITYPDEKTLAAFFGTFAAIVGSVQLLTSTFLSGPLITRFGLGFGLMALPALNVVGMGVAAGISLSLSEGRSFFCLILLTKLCDEALRSSLLAPSFRILYQPLPAKERLRFQAVTESIIEPLGVGLAGGVLLLFTHIYPLALHSLCLLLVVILITWLAVGERLRREYTQLLTQALSKRRLTEVSLSMEDGSTIQLFEEGLQSKNPGEVLYCLNMLEEVKHPGLKTFRRQLLQHHDEGIRINAIQKIEKNGATEDLPLLRDQLAHEALPHVRGALLRALCALAEDEALEIISPHLEDASPEVRSGAMAGLMRHGGIDGILIAGAKLQTMVSSSRHEDRLFAAKTLGEIGISSFYRPLLQLLHDPHPQVLHAAIRASGELNNPKLFPRLLECLHQSSLRSITFSTLIKSGKALLPLIQSTLENPETTTESRHRLFKLTARIGGPASISLLQRFTTIPDKSLRRQVLHSLALCGYRAHEDEVKELHTRIQNEVLGAIHALSAWVNLGSDPALQSLRHALENEIRNHQDQVLLLLSFLYDSKSLLFVRKELESRSSSQRAHALEVVDNVICNDLKSTILPLLDDLSPDERLRKLTSNTPPSPLTPHTQLRALIESASGTITVWTRACALYAAGKVKLQEITPLAGPFQHHPDPLLRETARSLL